MAGVHLDELEVARVYAARLEAVKPRERQLAARAELRERVPLAKHREPRERAAVARRRRVRRHEQHEVRVGDARARRLTVNGVQQYTPDGRARYDGLVIPGANATAINASRAALGLPVVANADLANLGLFGDIQAYNPSTKNWTRTLALSARRNIFGVDTWAAYTWQYGHQYAD